MAQKTEKEETELKVVPEKISPCINNTGSAAAASTAVAGVSNSTSREKKSHRSSSPRSLSSSSVAIRQLDLKKENDRTVVKEDNEENRTAVMKREVNRCLCCRKRVGLTGFRCRCGEMFCSEHRYSDRHDCSYDYRSAGREAIARENPLIKPAKIIKI